MPKNIKTKKPFNKRTLTAAVISLVVLLTASLAIFMSAPTAEAVNAGDINTLRNEIASTASGQSKTITLTANITGVINPTISIPSGANITLQMQGYTISSSAANYTSPAANDHAWIVESTPQIPPIFTVNGGGTLSLTGSGQVRCSGTIKIGNNSNSFSMNRTAIMNYGTLNVNGPKVYAGGEAGSSGGTDTGDTGELSYFMLDGDSTSNYKDVMSCAIGINNGAGGTVNFYSGNIVANARNNSNSVTWGTAGFCTTFAYGILNNKGGSVNMMGGTIDAVSHGHNTRNNAIAQTDGRIYSYAIGIENGTNGKLVLSGGNINPYSYWQGEDKATNTNTAHALVAMGIGYQGTNYPTITGGNIDVNFKIGDNWNTGTPFDLIAVGVSPTSVNNQAGSAGTANPNTSKFYDENGNLINGGYDMDVVGGMPVGLSTGGVTKYTVIYRYWPNAGKSGTPIVVTNLSDTRYTDRNVSPVGIANSGAFRTGYTQPWTDMPDISGGVLSGTQYVGYKSGGVLRNNRYYNLNSIVVRVLNMEDASPDHASAMGATPAASFGISPNGSPVLVSNTGAEIQAGKKAYIYIDYVTKNPSNLSLSLDNSTSVNTVTIPYTNANLVCAQDFNIYVKDRLDSSIDFTSRFKFNSSQNGLAVTYQFKKTTEPVSSFVGGLPKDVGDYTVRATIPEDKTYSLSCMNFNAPALGYYEFTIKIVKADPNITVQTPYPYRLTYGDRLNTISPADGCVINTANLTGTFTWLGGEDDSMAASATPYDRSIVFTPGGANGANFNTVTKAAKVYVDKRNINVNVSPGSAVFGNAPNFITDITNIPPKDSGKVSGWKASMTYTLNNGVSDLAYVAGATNVGSYTYRASSFADTINYNVSYNSSTFTVTPRLLTATAVAADKRYDGTTDVLVTFSNVTGGWSGHTYGVDYWVEEIMGTVPNSAVSDLPKPVTFPVPVVVGPQAINYTIVADSVTNYTMLAVRILKALPEYDIPVFPSQVYDPTITLSSFILPTVFSAGHEAGEWKWNTADLNKVPQVSAAASKFTATFYPTNTNDFDPVSVDIQLTITKRPVVVSATSAAVVTYGDPIPVYVYHWDGFKGSDTINNIAKTGGYSLVCSYRQNDPAGNYPIAINLASLVADNYSFTADTSSKLVVAKKALTVKATSYTFDYGVLKTDIPFEITAPGLVGTDTVASVLGTVSTSCSYDSAVAANRGVNTYPIIPNVSLTPANYIVNFENGTLTIQKKTVTLTANNVNVNYGDPVPAFTFNAEVLVFGDTVATAITGTPVFETSYTAASPTGYYDVNILSSSLSSANYYLTFGTGLVNCLKATPAVTQWPTASLTYMQTLAQAAVNTGSAASSVPGTYRFVNGATVPEMSDSGVTAYAIEFVPNDARNYNTVAGNITVTVNLRPITGQIGISGVPEVGLTLNADYSGINPSNASSYTYQWYADGAEIAGAVNSTYLLSAAETDKVITLKVTALSPYTGSSTSVETDAVIPAGMGLLPVNAGLLNYYIPSDITYDSNDHPISVVASDPVAMGRVTVKYNGSTTYPRFAGNYIVTVDVARGSAYLPTSGLYIGEFNITKAPYYVNFTPNNKVYDGTDTATVMPGTFEAYGAMGTDDVSFDRGGDVFKFTQVNVAQSVEVIMIGAKLTGNRADNYQLVYQGNYASITKAQIQLVAQPVSREYAAANYSIAVSFASNTYLPGVIALDRPNVSISSATGTLVDNTVGSRKVVTVNVTLTGSASGNYDYVITNLATLYVPITKANPVSELNLPVVAPLTYNAQRNLSSVFLSSDNCWSWNDTSIVPVVGNSGYKVTYRPVDTANYNIMEFTVPVPVNKAPLKIVINNALITYGDPVPVFTVNYVGFTGNEDETSIGGIMNFDTTYAQYADANIYPVSLNVSSLYSNNYALTSQDGVLTVSRKPLTHTVTAVSRAYIPGDRNVTVEFGPLTGIVNGDSVALNSYSTVGTVADANAANGKLVTFIQPTLTGAKSGNYTISTTGAGLKVDITKAEPVVTFPGEATVDFGKPLSAAIFTIPGSGNGTFKFQNPSFVPTAIGTFSQMVVFTPNAADINNYKTAVQAVNVRVVDAVINFRVTIYGSLMSGSQLSANLADFSGVPAENIKYTWYRYKSDSEILMVATTPTYTVTDADIGSYIQLKVELTTPYSGSQTVRSDSPIVEQQLSFWQKFLKWLYSIVAAITAIFGGIGK